MLAEPSAEPSADPSAPSLRYTGLLMDLLAPIRTGVADGCVIEGSTVHWQFPQHDNATYSGLTDPVVRRFSDSSTDWAQALLDQQFSDEDMFIHALADVESTFRMNFETPDLASGQSWSTHHATITVRVQWTSPRRITVTRFDPFTGGHSGTGMSMAMMQHAAAAVAKGHKVVYIDPKAGTP